MVDAPDRRRLARAPAPAGRTGHETGRRLHGSAQPHVRDSRGRGRRLSDLIQTRSLGGSGKGRTRLKMFERALNVFWIAFGAAAAAHAYTLGLVGSSGPESGLFPLLASVIVTGSGAALLASPT